jgi:hypothetical protein
MSPKPLTSAQIRAARALIRWSAQELATKTEVGVTTIRRAELTASATKLTRVNDQPSAACSRPRGWNSSTAMAAGREYGYGARNRREVRGTLFSAVLCSASDHREGLRASALGFSPPETDHDYLWMQNIARDSSVLKGLPSNRSRPDCTPSLV